MSESPQIVTVLGDIGGGKTTLALALKNEFENSDTLLEPVKEWKEKGILKAFYNDVPKLAFGMQMYAFSSRMNHLKTVLKEQSDLKWIFMDGHIISDKRVFKETLRESGHICDTQDLIYRETYRNWKMLVPEHKPMFYIYLKTSPETCLDRIKERNRGEETGISLEYLRNLDNHFDRLHQHLLNKNRQVILIDGNQDKDQVLSSTVQAIKEKFTMVG
jgi:deoxyadenosine/deoxycytidine kinase